MTGADRPAFRGRCAGLADSQSLRRNDSQGNNLQGNDSEGNAHGNRSRRRDPAGNRTHAVEWCADCGGGARGRRAAGSGRWRRRRKGAPRRASRRRRPETSRELRDVGAPVFGSTGQCQGKQQTWWRWFAFAPFEERRRRARRGQISRAHTSPAGRRGCEDASELRARGVARRGVDSRSNDRGRARRSRAGDGSKRPCASAGRECERRERWAVEPGSDRAGG